MTDFTAAPTSAAQIRKEAETRLAQYIRERGLKRSRPRELILSQFLAMGGHVSADDVHDRVRAAEPAIGRTTVYRALRLFCDAGIASSMDLEDGLTRFEPALSRNHHDHLICIRCGRIDEFVSEEVERLQEQAAAAHGYELVWHRHQLYGVCARCSAGGSSKSP